MDKFIEFDIDHKHTLWDTASRGMALSAIRYLDTTR